MFRRRYCCCITWARLRLPTVCHLPTPSVTAGQALVRMSYNTIRPVAYWLLEQRARVSAVPCVQDKLPQCHFQNLPWLVRYTQASTRPILHSLLHPAVGLAIVHRLKSIHRSQYAFECYGITDGLVGRFEHCYRCSWTSAHHIRNSRVANTPSTASMGTLLVTHSYIVTTPFQAAKAFSAMRIVTLSEGMLPKCRSTAFSMTWTDSAQLLLPWL